MAMRAPMMFLGALLLAQGFACSSGNKSTGPQTGSGGASGMAGMAGADASSGSGGSSTGSGGSDAATGADRGTGGTLADSGPGSGGAAGDAAEVGSGDAPGAMLPPGVPAGYKLLLDESFASAASMMAILAGNPQDWTHGEQDGGYLQYGGVGYSPPNPPVPDDFTSFALVRALKFGSFVLEVELMQRSQLTGVPVDMCIVFGIKSETELYFAHMAQGHTERFHNIVIINNAPRRSITRTDNGGIRWGTNQWHKVRLVRDVATGSVAVYMDGELATPILTAMDTTFTDGYIGFGTHEDSGRIRNLKVWGTTATAEPAPATFFR